MKCDVYSAGLATIYPLYNSLVLKVVNLIVKIMSSVKVFTFLIFLNCVNGNKYCAFEHDGEAKYYVCHLRNEYCCRLGCCVNLAFQFYQMWYYWLLLIFMFMLCSGGGWWYRFCRQPSVTSYTTNNPTSQHVSERQFQRRATLQQSHRRQRLVQAMQHSRVLMNDPSMNVVWKSVTNPQPPPHYYSSSNSFYHANNSQTALNYRASVQCPYYQLYGPPPSYESVVQISNGCGSTQPTCVLVTTNAVPCSFVTPSTDTATTLPLNDIPNDVPSTSVADQSTNIEDPRTSPVTTTLTNAIHRTNDFEEQPSTSSDIVNDASCIDKRKKSVLSSVSF